MEQNRPSQTQQNPGEKTFYELFGVEKENFDPAALKSAYKKLALKWHPDKNPDDPKRAEEMFKAISEAYQILSDDSKRAAYDRKLREEKDRKEGRARTQSNAQRTFSDADPRFRTGGLRFAWTTGFDFEDPWKLFERHFGEGFSKGFFGSHGSLFEKYGLSSRGSLFDQIFEGGLSNHPSISNAARAEKDTASPQTEKYIERTYHMSDGTVRKEYIKLDPSDPRAQQNSQSSPGNHSGSANSGQQNYSGNSRSDGHSYFAASPPRPAAGQYENLPEFTQSGGGERIRIKYVYR